jgi:triacylglycerol lipase
MVTRITQILLLLQALVAFAISAAAYSVLHFSLSTAVFMGLGLVLLVRMGITANNFVINRYYCGPASQELSLSWQRWLSLYLIEFRTTMYCSSWSMPFLAFTKRYARHPQGLPVLLVHGYGCNSGYWHGMSKALCKANISHYAVNLEPVFADIDDYVPRMREAINELCRDTGSEKVIILAHSMGGLATRAYLRADGDMRIAKVITLGSPHKGTGLANFGLGPNSQQMRWTGTARQGQSCNWLSTLSASEDEARMAKFVSIYSCHDNIIAPQTSSELSGAKNVQFKGVGHVALAYTPAVQQYVIGEILAAGEDARTPT